MLHLVRAVVLVLSLAAVGFAAESWTISEGTLAVGPKGKEATSVQTFTTKSPVDETLQLSSIDTLRLSFTTKQGGTATRPHQSFVLVEDPSTNLEVAIPVSVKYTGKAKLDLEQRDLPPQLVYAETLKLTLVVASFGDAIPLKVEFASVRPIINESSPAKPQPAERWGPKPEITHTFREPQKLPNKGLSAIFALAVVAGIPLLLVLFALASANISSLNTALSNAPIAHAGFFASLISFEIRFYKYWVNGTLGQILVESIGIAFVAFLTGRRALGEVMQRRAMKA